MANVSRRFFFRSVASALPVVAFVRCDGPEDADSGHASAPLAQDLLHALGESILPSELGAQGINQVVSDFQSWVAGYQPVAELNHGYGTGEIEYTPADPAPGWEAQLQALDLEVKRRHQSSFKELSPEARRELIRKQIAGEKLDRLPAPADARHIAIGLLAYYYGTPEATDLCYQAAIGKNTCRPLDAAPQKPAPLYQKA